ncbi:MAG: glycosyltransferase family 2 protein [Jatrophihabitans sp.]
MSAEAAARVRVTVVVPVYNPGAHIEALIDSLAAQTLPQDQFEVVFSNDGSTDETPARLDRLADERTNVTVIHEPNSGWPGRPRNLGMDVARGEYVFFVDQDDWLGVEALERMCAFARANHSDVLLGRYAGHRRGVAKAPFVKTKPLATMADTPLMDSLTPHKMFRTAFLRENDLRFPEGRRRLEDHVFVTQAYFLADRISVLADYHCYFHVSRDDAGNAGFQQIDPAGYYANVREVVDIVLAHTEPGAVRDRCLRRTLRTELLARLDGAKILSQSVGYQRAVFDEAHDIAETSMPLAVDVGLSPPQRVRATLLRQNRLDDLMTCVERYLDVRAGARLLDLGWDDAGAITVEVDAFLCDARTDLPWSYDKTGEQIYLRAPAGMVGTYPREVAECTKQLRGASVQVVLRRREDSEEWPVPTRTAVTLAEDGASVSARLRGCATFDVRTIGGGRLLTPGVWDVYARITQTGWSKDIRLGQQRTSRATAGGRAAVLSGTAVLPYWTSPHDNLSLDVGARAGRLAGRIRTRPEDVAVTSGADGRTDIRMTLPLVVPVDTELGGRLRLVSQLDGASSVDLEAGPLDRTADGVVARATTENLTAGEWQVLIALDVPGWGAPRPTGVRLEVTPTGTAVIADPVAAPTRRAVPASRPAASVRIRRKLRRLPGLVPFVRQARRLARGIRARRR